MANEERVVVKVLTAASLVLRESSGGRKSGPKFQILVPAKLHRVSLNLLFKRQKQYGAPIILLFCKMSNRM